MTEQSAPPAKTGTPQLAMALAKAQGAFRPIEKNRTVVIQTKSGGSYKFRYADLEELIDATRQHLAANGLSIVQLIAGANLRTVLLHESGEELASDMPLGAAAGSGDDIKTFGAKISYLRRYAYQSMLCLAADDDIDEDGEEAGSGQQQSRGKAEKKPDQPPAKPAYPDDQFTANLPLWEKRIVGNKATHADIIATVESKYTLNADQKKKINAIKSPAAAPAAEEAKP